MKAAGIVPHVSDMAPGHETDISLLLSELQLMITMQLSGYDRFSIFFRPLDLRLATHSHS